ESVRCWPTKIGPGAAMRNCSASICLVNRCPLAKVRGPLRRIQATATCIRRRRFYVSAPIESYFLGLGPWIVSPTTTSSKSLGKRRGAILESLLAARGSTAAGEGGEKASGRLVSGGDAGGEAAGRPLP